MPSAASYTNKIRFAASVKNIKTQYPGGVGNLTQGSIAGCGLDIQYTPVDYVEICPCNVNPPSSLLREYYINTIAGTGIVGYSGDGGRATRATFNFPEAICLDSFGNIYIADSGNNCIRKVDAITGIITTIAGTGTAGYSGDGGPATSATLYYPSGLNIDLMGNLYITDNSNNVIRKIDSITGIITTIAGTGTAGYSGDGGLAISAQLNFPRGRVVFDSVGNIYITDSDNYVIRKIDAITKRITTFAGTGTAGYSGDGDPAISAQLSYMYDMSIDSLGNIYVADSNNDVIRKIDSITGIITTIAGTGTAGYSGDGGLAISAQLNFPSGVNVDSMGNVYISDNANNVIRKIDAITKRITTIAGTGTAGYSGDGGPATSAELNIVLRMALFGNDIYIADSGSSRIRKL